MLKKLKTISRIILAFFTRPGLWKRTIKPNNLQKLRFLFFQHRTGVFLRILAGKIHLAIQSEQIRSKRPISSPGFAKARDLETAYPGITIPMALGNIPVLEDKFREPPHRVNPRAPARVNILLPHLDPLIMFGGYIACLHFIRKVQQAGFRVRVLLMESGQYDKDAVLNKLSGNPPLREAISQIEVEVMTHKRQAVEISPNDSFVGYSFWTCLKAHHLANAVGKTFIFFIQEYEPIFHPLESHYAIGDYVYRLPHRAIFNTQLLADYFRQMNLGVFMRYSGEDLARNHVAFQHALTPTKCPTVEEMSSRKTHRLLFYGRPESHARRNLLEIGVMGLRQAIRDGVFKGSWEFLGVGTLGPEYEVDLGAGYTMQLTGTLPQNDYGAAIGGYDIGLSLMLAPHPGILTFEMASAGLVVVTNTFQSRTEEVLRGISGNIEPCEADHISVAKALAQAVARMEDYASRVKAAEFDWVRYWDETFNSQVMERITHLLAE